jgi:hypothetical protein
MSDIGAFKLVSGEEVVATIIEEDSNKYVLDKPRTLLMTPGERGQVHLSMIPWMISAQDPNTKTEHHTLMYKSSIIGTLIGIPEQLKNGYIRNTSSIQLV